MSKIALRVGACVIMLMFASRLMSAPYVGIKGYSITPPDGWSQRPGTGGIDMVFYEPGHTASPPMIQVGVMQTPPNESGKDDLTFGVDSLLVGEQKSPGFHLIVRGLTTIAGQPAGYFAATFSNSSDASISRIREVYFLHAHNSYFVACSAPDSDFGKYRAMFDVALQSFGFATGEGNPYVSPSGYSITPPPNWTVKPDYDGLDLALAEQGANTFAANMDVKLTKSHGRPPPGVKLDVNLLWSERSGLNSGLYGEYPGYAPISQSLTSYGGTPAISTVFLATLTAADGTPLRLRVHDVMMPHGDTVFQFTCISLDSRYDTYSPIFEQMLNSIQWN